LTLIHDARSREHKINRTTSGFACQAAATPKPVVDFLRKKNRAVSNKI